MDAVVVLDIPDADATARLVNQRVDPETGILYNLEISPPSDPAVAERLVQRSEDSEEAVAAKIALHQVTMERDLVFRSGFCSHERNPAARAQPGRAPTTTTGTP